MGTVTEGTEVSRATTRFSARQQWALIVVGAGVGLDASNVGVVNTALPAIQRSLTMSESTLQWMVSAYALTFAGLLLFGGRLADVFSRRLIFVLGVVLFVLGAVAAAVAPSAVPLLAARALQGIGGALSMPAAMALLFDIFPAGALRNRALGIFTSIAGGSFSGGLIFGGLLAGTFGWRSVFVFTAVIGGLALVGARYTLPAGTTHRRRLDLPGAAAITIGLALIIYGVSHGGAAGWSAPATVGSLALGALLVVGFVGWEWRTREALLPLGILRSVPVVSATVAAFVSFGGVIGVIFFTPQYMQNTLHFTPIESAVALVALTGAVFVAANPTARLLTRGVSKQLLMIAGLLLIAAGLASLVWTPAHGSYWVYLFPGFLVVGVGVGVSGASATSSALSSVARQQQGVSGAVNATAKQIGASIGTALLVAVFAAATSGGAGSLAGYHAAYLTAAGLVLAGTVAVAVLSLVGRWSPAARP